MLVPLGEKPSCLQTTMASGAFQRSSHTVPYTSLLQSSTRPSRDEEPPTSLIRPFWQPARHKILRHFNSDTNSQQCRGFFAGLGLLALIC